MGKHYSNEFKQEVVNDYNSGKYGGMINLGKHYNISSNTLRHWIDKDRKQKNQINDIEHKRGRPKETNIDYKERYEILKKYQEFIKAQREKK
jgi:transposase-like protein